MGDAARVCILDGVRGGEGRAQLVWDEDTGRPMVRGINEGGFGCVDLDLSDLLGWLNRAVPGSVDIDRIEGALPALTAIGGPAGHRSGD